MGIDMVMCMGTNLSKYKGRGRMSTNMDNSLSTSIMGNCKWRVDNLILRLVMLFCSFSVLITLTLLRFGLFSIFFLTRLIFVIRLLIFYLLIFCLVLMFNPVLFYQIFTIFIFFSFSVILFIGQGDHQVIVFFFLFLTLPILSVFLFIHFLFFCFLSYCWQIKLYVDSPNL